MFDGSDDEKGHPSHPTASPDENEIVSAPTPKPKSTPKKAKAGGNGSATPRVDKRSVKDEKSRQEMLERLEKARVKALEVRLKNKAERELLAKEEQAKVEKVATFLKNDDLFEKKYADKFEKITDMLSQMEGHLSEVKETKKKKLALREEEKAQKEKAMALLKADLDKQNEEKSKVEEKPKAAITTTTYVPLTPPSAPLSILPNYRSMNFGRRKAGHY
jgi:hypothetical protein